MSETNVLNNDVLTEVSDAEKPLPTYHEACKIVMKEALAIYKTTKSAPSNLPKEIQDLANTASLEIKAIGDQYTQDNILFTKLQKWYLILKLMLKFAMCRNDSTYQRMIKMTNSTLYKDFLEIEVSLPNDEQEIILMFNAYPEAIDIHHDMYDIVRIEDYKLLLLTAQINYMLYYNVVDDPTFILDRAVQINEFCERSKTLFKKMVKEHTQEQLRELKQKKANAETKNSTIEN
jgi:hypothetical protein